MPMDSITEPAEHVALGSPATAADDSADLTTVLTGAVEAAKAAIIEVSGEGVVGEYLGASFDDPSAATHRFLAVMPGYQGWQWAVVVAAYPGADHATISEVVLVPGPTALLAPAWVPWQERIQPGDLSPGDLLAPPTDDPRLVPGYLSSGDPELDEVAGEIGLGRRQVLSQWGRIEAAQRWYDGDTGPGSAMARSTRRPRCGPVQAGTKTVNLNRRKFLFGDDLSAHRSGATTEVGVSRQRATTPVARRPTGR